MKDALRLLFAGAKPFTELLAEGGDTSTGRFVATHGAKTGALSYWLNVSGQTSDGTPVSGSYEPKVGVIQQRNPTKNIPAVLEDGGRRLNSDAKQLNAWGKLGFEPSAATAVFLKVHCFDRDKGAPPATDVVQVLLRRPAFSQLARIPTYRDLGVDLDAKHQLGANLTLKAKGFWHEHVDDYESYKDPAYTETIAISRYDDSLGGGSLLAEWQASSPRTRFPGRERSSTSMRSGSARCTRPSLPSPSRTTRSRRSTGTSSSARR
jgi:iron complex outermembrane receptor protein